VGYTTREWNSSTNHATRFGKSILYKIINLKLVCLNFDVPSDVETPPSNANSSECTCIYVSLPAGFHPSQALIVIYMYMDESKMLIVHSSVSHITDSDIPSPHNLDTVHIYTDHKL